MLQIALTGGIGAGKSAVAARLVARGAALVDADALARAAVAPGTPGLSAVVAEFGPAVLDPAGALDRPALGRLVFADAAARGRLEAIVHPRVRDRAAALVAAARPDAIVVHDIPLLVETGRAAAYPLVLVVEAGEAVRLARLAERGLTPAEAAARMAAQAPAAQRRAAADVLLPNEGTLAALYERVDAVWADRLVPFEANLRADRPARRAPLPRPGGPGGGGSGRDRGTAGAGGVSRDGGTAEEHAAAGRAAAAARAARAGRLVGRLRYALGPLLADVAVVGGGTGEWLELVATTDRPDEAAAAARAAGLVPTAAGSESADPGQPALLRYVRPVRP
ncbi:hypothetical protein GCM10010123_08190 [Pilimelia anulata]|uniref:Dephospho-CoA kinase n=1 Tax=Pilimelia anulata TaxID=53371 RepID=A0A8J3B0F7_9ACTN|nr:dephospho-CoA kinase [Pilimelia anulata]GGJ80624.1 hypothetical protein GCM10010123_08190 [Pilimelia anulata]